MRRRMTTLSLAVAVAVLVPGSAAADPGDLDDTFSDNGKLTLDFDGGFESIEAMDIGDGRIVIGGDTRPEMGLDDFAMAAFRFDGELDPSLGGDGRVVIDFMGLGGSDAIIDLHIMENGKILAVGYAQRPDQEQSGFAVARFRRNGTLDPTFSGDGKVRTLFPQGRSFAYAVDVQPNGRIVVGGEVALGVMASDYDFALARYMPNGNLDATFGEGGRTTTDFAGDSDGIWELVLQPDGKILVAGWSRAGDDYRFAAARYRSDGSRDGTFGGDGRVVVDLDPLADDYALGMGLRDDGKIVLGGQVDFVPDGGQIGLVRLRPNGQPDPGFGGGDGKVISNPSGGGGTYPEDMALQDDGRILVAGSLEAPDEEFLFVARYLPGGGLDTGFGSNGMAHAAFASDSDAYGEEVGVQPNGKIVAAGEEQGHGDAAVARFLP